MLFFIRNPSIQNQKSKNYKTIIIVLDSHSFLLLIYSIIVFL
nr:MAG TPA: hypothetical protein [Caudoviricetes sp.]